MQAIILAGGFGTRLQAVVKDVPKPLADISGKPFLSYLFQHLKNCGIKNVVISVGYLQEKIIEYFGENYLGINLVYAKEDKPLGTGGAIKNSLKFIDKKKPVIVINGDTFLQVNYQKLLAFHQEKKSQLTMVLREVEDCSRYGRVVADGDHVVSFEEKNSTKNYGLINGGIYVLDEKIFTNFSAESFSFEKDFLMEKLQELQPQGFIADEYFIDIGIPEDYSKAQKELPTLLKKNKALFLDRDGVINIDCGHVFEIEKFHFIDGIFELCKRAQDLGYSLIIVTNQAGIAKGFYSEEQFLELTKWMENEFQKRGIKISKTFYCPFHIEANIKKYRQDSFDRKPNPGMFLKAIDEFNIDPTKSLMIGDKESDIKAAEAAKIGFKFLLENQKNLKEFILEKNVE
jgi:D,D-heptose 1,7-bisphosphate phosphatase